MGSNQPIVSHLGGNQLHGIQSKKVYNGMFYVHENTGVLFISYWGLIALY